MKCPTCGRTQNDWPGKKEHDHEIIRGTICIAIIMLIIAVIGVTLLLRDLP